jgi:magnesium chelatase subunit H
MRFVLVTLNHHLTGALERARVDLARDIPGLDLRVHVAADWGGEEAAAACRDDITSADIVVVTQLFMDDEVRAVRPALEVRAAAGRTTVCAMCAPELMRATRLGGFSMAADAAAGRFSPMALLGRLRRGRQGSDGGGARGQMRALRMVPRLLRWVPGTAQDVRAYFVTLQFWLAGSQENLRAMVLHLCGRYGADGGRLPSVPAASEPVEYPDCGVYHPDLPGLGLADRDDRLPARNGRPTVGLLLMRSYLLSGNTAHYDAVIRALEARGLATLPVFASGLDARPAADRFLRGTDGRARIDALVSLTGFSLVGGPAYSDSAAAAELLTSLDVPYLAVQALEFQSVEEWRTDVRGLNPLQATLMVAIPELDGACGPLVFAGKQAGADGVTRCAPVTERVERLAARVERLVRLRRARTAERRVGIVVFGFPPNAGAVGTAAYLAVWESLYRTMLRMREDGYDVDVPENADALRERVLGGNADRLGSTANVHARIRTDDHVRREPWLREIEAVWGPAPGKQNADGGAIRILGERFGNVFVGVQPPFGYEGDPMRLLFERGFAPTHAFSAFYRWIREDFDAHALLHFGTHGALEFMPGKQVGLDDRCWPDRLIGDVPNVYLYASNNPSEGTLAKRRSAATLVSYLTPPITRAGLYRGLLDLKSSLDRRGADGAAAGPELDTMIQAQAAAVDLADAEPAWTAASADAHVARLRERVLELEYSLIPHGLHVVGEPMTTDQRVDLIEAMELAPREVVERVARGEPDDSEAGRRVAAVDRLLAADHETPAILRALDGRFIAPAPGGDVLRNPAVLPTGRNVYGFDPFRVPSAFAMREGRRQADRLLERHRAEGGELPATVGMVLWGTDNMKSEGAPIAQALALMGAEPRFDGYGRLVGASLVPLDVLGRARVDVVLTLSGIFRDLLPLQVRLLAEAAWLAASADEPESMNPVRRNALRQMKQSGCDMETAALRVFSNAEGAYGANVNALIESGAWNDGDELAESFLRRKSFAYGRGDESRSEPDLLRALLANTDATYQNLESVELGVSDVDQYVDGLGGMSRAATRLGGGAPVPAYIGDETRGEGRVRTLGEQVSLESRTRMLNPKWYEEMLRFGYEGVRQIEAHLTTTLGWSATTGAVESWVYTRVGETYLLDEEMRRRLAAANPTAAARMADRLLEAHGRGFWDADDDMLAALRDAADELEDRLEGIYTEAAA